MVQIAFNCVKGFSVGENKDTVVDENANVYANIVSATDVNATGIIIAEEFYGNGSNLANITAANIVGSVPSATTAGTVTANAQSNITSVGTLSSLSVTANIDAGNVIATGDIDGNVITAATGFFLNPTTITANYVVPNGYNASSAGPLTIADNVIITIPDGSAWIVN